MTGVRGRQQVSARVQVHHHACIVYTACMYVTFLNKAIPLLGRMYSSTNQPSHQNKLRGPDFTTPRLIGFAS